MMATYTEQNWKHEHWKDDYCKCDHREDFMHDLAIVVPSSSPHHWTTTHQSELSLEYRQQIIRIFDGVPACPHNYKQLLWATCLPWLQLQSCQCYSILPTLALLAVQ